MIEFRWTKLFLNIGWTVILLLSMIRVHAQSETNVYFIPGQGADYRLFDSIQLDTGFTINHIKYSLPKRGMKMEEYARELANQIDTTTSYILVGTSLGGMLASEMSEFMNPQKVIVISSAKCRKELPFRYKFQKFIPVFEIIPRFLIKKGAVLLQPLVESESKINQATFRAMLQSKDSRFLKRTIRMIVNWNKKGYNPKIIHIHGTSDKTIPIKNVKYQYRVLDGSHMITLTKFEAINYILKEELVKNM